MSRSDMGASAPILLHLTDLHFGYDTSLSGVAARELALRGLVGIVSSLEPEWRPNIVCISGDLGWRGHASDYNAAKEWLAELLLGLKLSPEHLAMCPGNHDIDRNVSQKYARPKDGMEADRILSVPIAPMYQDAFRAFTEFSHSLGIPPYRLGDMESHLVGQRCIDGISVCALNSSWFCQGADDQLKLWIGRPHVDLLEYCGQLPHPEKLDDWLPTVVLMHHPKEWFHDEEIHGRGTRPNTFDVLVRRCHLLLSGHAHGESRRADRYAEAAWHLDSGATYAGSDYQNGFTIIRTEDDRFIYRTFEYDPRSSDREWRQTIGAAELPLRKTAQRSAVPAANAVDQGLDRLRVAAAMHAQRVVEAKSRALRPWGALPKTLPLGVFIRTAGARPRFNHSGQLEPEKVIVSVPLLHATRAARRILLLGDLGSGKSTISAAYVSQYQDTTSSSLAIYALAKSIPTDTVNGVPWRTVKDFIQAVSSYLSGQVFPREPGFNLEPLLESRVEVALIVDGLDEVHPTVAQSILHQLVSIVDHWPTTQVLATGRPVELAGVDYARWQLCTPASLTDDERLQFFAEEALADGQHLSDADSLAAAALDRLRGLPDLYSLASTPLFCRLLFKQLGRRLQGKAPSLGDLLYELIRERLAGWAKQDLKVSPTPAFDSVYPDADSRAALLSQLALRSHTRRGVRVEEARLHLDALMPAVSTASKPSLIEEALRSFENSGVVTVDAEFQFTLRPLEEFLCGYAHAIAPADNRQFSVPSDPNEWRIASFAATMARRLGLTSRARPVVHSFIQQLLRASHNVPAASYIISELQDEVAAASYVDELRALGRRPLWLSFDALDWKQTAHVIAESLALAGDAGFSWFFDEYLDPRYPFVFAGSKATDEIFEQWAAIHVGRLSEGQKLKLNTLVRPHLAAASHQVITIVPLLAVLIPEALAKNDRLWFCSRLLDNPQFRQLAELQIKEAIGDGEGDLVSNILVGAAATGFEYARTAATLQLSASGGRLPIEVVRGLVRAERGRENEKRRKKGVQMLVERLGPECVKRFLRWFLFDLDTMLAAGAAIELYDSGERRLPFLGLALLRALHDGGYVQRAEEVLAVLVDEAGAEGVRWIAFHVAMQSPELIGAYSGWWRILLKGIRRVGTDAPRLLAQCMCGIDEFLLPRHPEVRQGFRELLTGSDSEASGFRAALRDDLGHPDPAVRHGAAMVLITSDPMTEARALEEVVRSKSRQRHGAWYEWERFCLSLKFGPSVVSHIESRLGSFPSEAEIFALAILYRNGVELTAAQFESLVSGELAWVIGVDEPSQSLNSERSLEVLLRIAEGGSNTLAVRAAEKLINRFPERLTAMQHAKVVALTLDASHWRTPEFQKELLRMKQDPSYADLIREASEQLVRRGFKRPVIDQLHQAEEDPAIWEGLIWNELCTGAVGHDAERHGQWILDLVREFPEQARAVGPAARKFLSDARLEQSHAHDAIAWLALLAHEGGLLSERETEQVIVRHSPVDASVWVALIARLGRVPENFRPRYSVGMPPLRPLMQPPPAANEALEALREYARPSDTLHPQLCPTVERSLLDDPLTADQLSWLAQQGKNGILIAGALAVVYGQLPQPEWAVAILGYRRPRPVPEDQCHAKLVEIWQRILGTGQSDNEWQRHYIAELNRALSTESGEVSVIASELLASQRWLDPEQARIALRQLTLDIFDDHGLTARLAEWLSGDLPEEVRSSLIAPVEQGLSSLDGQPWDSDRSYPRDAGPYLLLPLLHWRISGQTDDRSKRVFLRGLRMALMPERQQPNRESRRQGLEDVIPLLNSVPKSILQEVVRYGTSIDDLAVRGLCRLFVLESFGVGE